MPIVELTLSHHRYPIVIEPGALSRAGERVRAAAPHTRAAVFADEAVASRFGPVLAASLSGAGYDTLVTAMPSGERHKTLDAVRRMYGELIRRKMERRSPVIALGGGVIGDSAGFAAASYLRGVPLVQCPTTLLSMVDASVGGKVGVNLPEGKNLVGAFHQPSLVVIDTDTLGTLPGRELRGGLAECVKHAVIRSPERFDWLEQNVDRVLAMEAAALVELVEWNVRIKAAVVMRDEKEAPGGERAHLNFGHTFGHALEAVQHLGREDAAGAYHHGEAVAIGMVAATRLAIDAGRCEASLLGRLEGLLARIGLPVRVGAGSGLVGGAALAGLCEAMTLDKKVADGKVRLVLPTGMGRVETWAEADRGRIASAWRYVGV